MGEEGAHEKGGIEGDVGRFRRAYLVPVPEVATLAELNEWLAVACVTDLRRTIRGRRHTVGEALGQEIDLLRPLPADAFDAAEHATPRVDSKSLATVRQNQYSLPVGSPGCGSRPGSARGRSSFVHDGREVARHERLHGRFGTRRSWITTLSCSTEAGSARPVARVRQERERGAWPDCFDELWRGIQQRVGCLGGSEADGRRAAALPRAACQPGRARRPRRACRGRARRPGGAGPRPSR